jgi:glycosyltransferase involved in cell wall biosynthesis
MRVLLVNQTFYPDNAASAQHLLDVALALKDQGCEVTVLSGRAGYLNGQLHAAAEIYHGITIKRVWPFAVRCQNKFFRILSAAAANIAFIVQLLRLRGFERTVALTSPPMVSTFASFAARLQRSVFVYWVLDLNPDQAIQAGWLKQGSLAAVVLEWIAVKTLKSARVIVVPDVYMRARLLGKGIAGDKIEVVPIWALQNSPQQEESEKALRTRYGLRNKFVVMYSGNHSVCHPLTTLLEAGLKLRDEDIVFLFIGNGARSREVAEFKLRHGLENIIQLPYQDRSELACYLAVADLHVVIMGEAFVGIVHPSKVYGILAAGRPFVYIGPRHGPMADIVQKLDPALTVLHGQVDELTRLIKEFRLRSQEEILSLREHARMLSQGFERTRRATEVANYILRLGRA